MAGGCTQANSRAGLASGGACRLLRGTPRGGGRSRIIEEERGRAYGTRTGLSAAAAAAALCRPGFTPVRLAYSRKSRGQHLLQSGGSSAAKRCSGRKFPYPSATAATDTDESSSGGSLNGDALPSSIEVVLNNELEKVSTVVTITAQSQQNNLLASVASAFNTLGLVIIDATMSLERESGSVKVVFSVTEVSGAQIAESEWPNLRDFLVTACTFSSNKSSAPAIYGVAAAAEARWLRTLNAGATSVLAKGQGAMAESISTGSMEATPSPEAAAARGEAAAALELAAAEMAQAAAFLVSVERAAADITNRLAGSPEDEEIYAQLVAQEDARVEASAVLERRMAAMEAALASRRQFKQALKQVSATEEESAANLEAEKIRALMQQSAESHTIGTGPATGNGYEIFLQAFNWESKRHPGGWYNMLEEKLPELKAAGFTSLWLPPPTASVSEEGYLPTDLYNLNSKYGSESELKQLVTEMSKKDLKSVADIVINHRCASAQKDGKWNQFGGRLAWDETVITANNPEWGGRGSRSTGDEYWAAPNIDHTQETVRNNIKEWLRWLKNNIGVDGWRFDFVKGYSGEFTKEYVDATVPKISIGEYWDACDYTDGVLDYNQDSHRQRTVNWCDSSGGTSGAFDFTTKGVLQEACARGEYWRLIDPQGRAPGVIGMWPSRAVTFIDNHDTGSTLNHWPFPERNIQEGYTYILTHPGTPCVFWDHWVDDNINEYIKKLMQLRVKLRISSRSKLTVMSACAESYAAVIDGKLGMKIGPGDWTPNRCIHEETSGKNWVLNCSGYQSAVWVREDIEL